jgi:hypothetical protein
MTLDETRDEIAEALGYEYGTWGWQKQAGDKFQVALRHPVPATLDAIAALWPKGYSLHLWKKPDGSVEMFASVGSESGQWKCGSNLLETWASLLLAVLRHEKGAE